ncbi:MAG: DUF4625 domain-containing protein [bacterium]
MKRNKITTLVTIMLLFATTAFVSSCNKSDDDNPDPTPTDNFSTKVTSPEEGKTFHSGATVKIEAEISDDKELHGYAVRIINKSMNDTEVFKSEHRHMHAKSYTISETWVNNVTHHSDMQLQIIAYIDHEGTERVQTVDFHCHP